MCTWRVALQRDRVALCWIRAWMSISRNFTILSVRVNYFMRSSAFVLRNSKRSINTFGPFHCWRVYVPCTVCYSVVFKSFSLVSYSLANWRVLNMDMYVRPGSGPMQNVMKLGCSDLWALTCVCFGSLAKTCSIQIGTCKIVQINQNWYRKKSFKLFLLGSFAMLFLMCVFRGVFLWQQAVCCLKKAKIF